MTDPARPTDADARVLGIIDGAPRSPRSGGAWPAREVGDQRHHVERLEAAAAMLTNDTGNGERLRHWFGDELLHVRDVGWHVWTGKVWEPEGAAEAVMRMAQVVARGIAAEAAVMRPEGEREREVLAAVETARAQKLRESEDEHAAALAKFWGGLRAKRRGFSLTSGNSARVANMISSAECHVTVPIEAMDRDPFLFNCTNGTLVFERSIDPECPDPSVKRLVWSERLRPHDRADRLAKLAPVAYDPKAKCPKWTEFLERFQPDEKVRLFLQTYAGYALLGVIGAQKLLFLYGEGANGKSTFVEALARLLGPYGRTLNAESLTGTASRAGAQATPDLAQLPGARFVRVSELPRGEKLRESLVKQLTGGEPMMVRHNYGNFFEFYPVFKAVMSGNDKPEIGGLDLGIWRRLALVHWAVTIPDGERRDMNEVLAEFAAEAPGMLNWLIEGALRYLAEGLKVPDAVQQFTDDYRSDQDPVQGFIDSCVHRSANEADTVTSAVLYDAFECWMLANAVGKPWSNKAFSMAMVRKGFVKRDDGRLRHFTGLILHDVPQRPAAPDGARYGK